MTETIMLRCKCGSSMTLEAPRVDIAAFLRTAIAGGWRRIDPEPVKALDTADGTRIELYGECDNCSAKTRQYLTDRIARRERSVR